MRVGRVGEPRAQLGQDVPPDRGRPAAQPRGDLGQVSPQDLPGRAGHNITGHGIPGHGITGHGTTGHGVAGRGCGCGPSRELTAAENSRQALRSSSSVRRPAGVSS